MNVRRLAALAWLAACAVWAGCGDAPSRQRAYLPAQDAGTRPEAGLPGVRGGSLDAGTGLDGAPTQDAANPVDAGQETGPGADAGPACEQPLAAGVRLDALTLYQGVSVPLVEAGERVYPRNAPVVQGRDALLRAFVTPQPSATHPLTAELVLLNGDDTTTLTTRAVPAPGREAEPASTFNLDIDGALIGPDTRFRFALLEDDCDGPLGEAADARFPTRGDTPLDAEAVGPLRVAFVPIAYETASWPSPQVRSPDTDVATLQRYVDALTAMYPVTEVLWRVTEPLPWDDEVAPVDDAAWDDLLDGVLARRQADRLAGTATRDEYYYGLFRPRSDYCEGDWGCIAGLGMLPQSPSATGAVGLAFDDQLSYDTLVHELGHNHGREHVAGCGLGPLDGVDGDYPHASETIGVWGYDLLDGSWRRPTDYADIMGYCERIWVSDYTYEALGDWVAEVNAPRSPRLRKGLARAAQRALLVHADGRMRWSAWQPDEPPAGQPVPVEALGARGEVLEVVAGERVALGHGAGHYLFVPEPAPGWVALRFEGREARLADL